MRTIIQEGELRRWTSHSMKSRPWHTTSYFVVLKNKNGKIVKKKIVEVKPAEFKKFFSSKNQYPAYQKEIDKYNLILSKLFEKDKSIRNRITKLKGMI